MDKKYLENDKMMMMLVIMMVMIMMMMRMIPIQFIDKQVVGRIAVPSIEVVVH